MKKLISACVIVFAALGAARAEAPADVVRYFYESPDEVFNVDNPRLADPLLAVMKSNAAHND